MRNTEHSHVILPPAIAGTGMPFNLMTLKLLEDSCLVVLRVNVEELSCTLLLCCSTMCSLCCAVLRPLRVLWVVVVSLYSSDAWNTWTEMSLLLKIDACSIEIKITTFEWDDAFSHWVMICLFPVINAMQRAYYYEFQRREKERAHARG